MKRLVLVAIVSGLLATSLYEMLPTSGCGSGSRRSFAFGESVALDFCFMEESPFAPRPGTQIYLGLGRIRIPIRTPILVGIVAGASGAFLVFIWSLLRVHLEE
jgi:hypothetical protein